jgi:hypothetical protein
MPVLNPAENFMGFRFRRISTTNARTNGDTKTKEAKASRSCRGVFTALFLALIFVAALPAWAVEPYSIEPVELNTKDAHGHATIDQALADKLGPQGWRLWTESNGLKVTVCEVFWVKAANVQARLPGGKSFYDDLEPGSLVGVIHFLPETDEDYREDFHDQKLKPGYYTMRYAPRPKGDPSEVLLLSPASSDGKAERVLSQDELERRSRLASGSREPAVLSLVSPELSKEEAPILRMDDQGTCIFQVKLQTSSGASREATLAVILVTPRKGEGDAS